MASTVPVFYDCEASGLDGVPIEIGWAFADAQTGTITSEGHLASPAAAGLACRRKLGFRGRGPHGITLDQLRGQGRSVWEIAQRMDRLLDGRE